MHTRSTRVGVIGAGLGGLAAAVLLARGGADVTLLEGSAHLGGRARSHRGDRFTLNLGPHALYRRGAAQRLLDRLAIDIPGGDVDTSVFAFVDRSEISRARQPGLGLIGTPALDDADRAELRDFLAALPQESRTELGRLPVASWLERRLERPRSRRFALALVRLATYADEPQVQAADAARDQLLVAAGGVRYVDGGWQTIVDALLAAARDAGVDIRRGARVTAIERDPKVRALRCRSGTIEVDAAVAAVGSPQRTDALTDGATKWAARTTPVRAACLDVTLSRLPDPSTPFALGWGQPTYLSVHSTWADLTTVAGGAVVHVARYLGAEPPDPDDRRQLESLLDVAQPGWREHVVEARFLPQMTVAWDVVAADRGGMAGRPGPAVSAIPGLHLVGDWVGREGMLADATVASAVSASAAILGHAADPADI